MITFKELVATCTNVPESIEVYLDDDQWDSMIPETSAKDFRDIPSVYAKMSVDSWEMDANFNLRVFLY